MILRNHIHTLELGAGRGTSLFYSKPCRRCLPLHRSTKTTDDPFCFLLTSGLCFGLKLLSRTEYCWASMGWDSLPAVCEKAFSLRGRACPRGRQMALYSAFQFWFWKWLSGVWAFLLMKWDATNRMVLGHINFVLLAGHDTVCLSSDGVLRLR